MKDSLKHNNHDEKRVTDTSQHSRQIRVEMHNAFFPTALQVTEWKQTFT